MYTTFQFFSLYGLGVWQGTNHIVLVMSSSLFNQLITMLPYKISEKRARLSAFFIALKFENYKRVFLYEI